MMQGHENYFLSNLYLNKCMTTSYVVFIMLSFADGYTLKVI